MSDSEIDKEIEKIFKYALQDDQVNFIVFDVKHCDSRKGFGSDKVSLWIYGKESYKVSKKFRSLFEIAECRKFAACIEETARNFEFSESNWKANPDIFPKRKNYHGLVVERIYKSRWSFLPYKSTRRKAFEEEKKNLILELEKRAEVEVEEDEDNEEVVSPNPPAEHPISLNVNAWDNIANIMIIFSMILSVLTTFDTWVKMSPIPIMLCIYLVSLGNKHHEIPWLEIGDATMALVNIYTYQKTATITIPIVLVLLWFQSHEFYETTPNLTIEYLLKKMSILARTINNLMSVCHGTLEEERDGPYTARLWPCLTWGLLFMIYFGLIKIFLDSYHKQQTDVALKKYQELLNNFTNAASQLG